MLCVVLLFSGQVYALGITPADAYNLGNETGQSFIDAYLVANYSDIGTELYKQDVGGGESGALAGSYSTTFDNDPLDPSEATITYTGGDVIDIPAYLLVKDGNHSPAWYLFLFDGGTDGLVWNGTDTLVLTDFWPQEGAISHVAFYGESTSVPESAGLFLLGTGFIGLAAMGRRRFKK